MHKNEIKAIFDKQASEYDAQWLKMASIYNCLYFLLETVFSELPRNARILCVGVGTGKELIYLAKKYPNWRFTAVEPSGAMLNVCRQQTKLEGLTERCDFHEGYLETLPTKGTHDAATCFLVSQFILHREERVEFFEGICGRLKLGGILANADLSADVSSTSFDPLLRLWQRIMSPSDVTHEGLERMRTAYSKNVAILSSDSMSSIIKSAGFDIPIQFFQSALIQAWFTKRISSTKEQM